MSFGSTLGGMGQASIGMDQAADAANRRISMQQVAEDNAMRMRLMREQDDNARSASAAYKQRLAEMGDGNKPLPQATAGPTVQGAPQEEPAPVVTGYSNEGRSVPTRKGAEVPSAPNYDAAIAQYEAMVKDNQAKLDALKKNPNAQATSDNAALRKGAAQVGDQLLMPFTAVKNAAVGVGKGINRAIGAVTGKAGPLEKSEYSSFTPLQDGVPVDPATDYASNISGAQKGIEQLRALKSAQAAKSAPQGGSSVVTPEFIAAIKRVENRSGDPNAVSQKGAFGVMQTMPGTFDQMSKTYYGGTLDPKNAADQEKAGVAYLNHLATVELPRLGIPVTQANVAAAYQQGPGGLAKNGISAGVSDGITNNAEYVRKVMGGIGAAPQQAPGQPQQPTQAPPGFLPKEAAQAYGGPNIDQRYQQAQQARQFLMLQAQNTPETNPERLAQIMTEIQKIDAGMQDIQVMGLARQALADPDALTQMVGLFAGTFGPKTQLAAQSDASGRFRLVNQEGQPAPGAFGQPQSLQQLVGAMHQQMSQGLTSAAIQEDAAYRAESNKQRAKYEWETPMELTKANVAASGTAAAAQIRADGRLLEQVNAQRISENELKAADPDPSIPGGLIIRSKNRVFTYVPGNSSDPSKPATKGTITQVQIPQG